MLRLRMCQAVGAAAFLGLAGLCTFGAANAAQAETRRAFVLGEQRYTDPDIQSLTRSDADAATSRATWSKSVSTRRTSRSPRNCAARPSSTRGSRPSSTRSKRATLSSSFIPATASGSKRTTRIICCFGSLKSLQDLHQVASDRSRPPRDDIISFKMPVVRGPVRDRRDRQERRFGHRSHEAIAEKKPKVAFVVP